MDGEVVLGDNTILSPVDFMDIVTTGDLNRFEADIFSRVSMETLRFLAEENAPSSWAYIDNKGMCCRWCLYIKHYSCV